MKCRYCNVALSPLRSLTDGEFCCDEHRQTFFQEKVAGLVAPSPPAESPLASLQAAVSHEPPQVDAPVAVRVVGAAKPSPLEDLEDVPPAAEGLLPIAFQPTPADFIESGETIPARNVSVELCLQFPRCQAGPVAVLDPLQRDGDGTAADLEAGEAGLGPHPARDILGSWRFLTHAWKNAPADLRVITLLLPVLLGIALGPSIPKLRVPKVSSTDVQQAMASRFRSIHQTILNRAAIAFADDFRSGLDAWDSRSNLTTSWSYDATGFVQPGPLALFKPTMEMSDYRFEFLGEIDRKALGAAFRAQDLDNYYAVKFVVSKPGPLPLVHLVRYPVINGKEGPHVEKPLPLNARADMLYRIMVDVRGSDFTILAQGQVIDFWSDNRLQHGGVGFFCSRGEKSRVRWVEVSHQYDALGRLCAYLAPYGIESRNGTWN